MMEVEKSMNYAVHMESECDLLSLCVHGPSQHDRWASCLEVVVAVVVVVVVAEAVYCHLAIQWVELHY